MDPCSLCTSTVVVDDAGKTICGECGTERGMHTHMIGYGTATGRPVLTEKKRVQDKKVVTERTEEDAVIDDWNPCEGFDIILRHWTKVLYGVVSEPEHFKTVVSKIWFTYLQKTNIAFIDNNQEPSRFFSRKRMLATRGISRLSEPKYMKFSKTKIPDKALEKMIPANRSITTNRIHKFLEKYSLNETNKKQEQSVLDQTDFYVEENCSDEDTDSIDRSRLSLHLHTVFAVLYLAILACDEDILLLDLIRWSREGHLPFKSAIQLVTPHYKIGKYYGGDFSDSPLAASKYRASAGMVAAFVNIDSLPIPSYKRCLARIVSALKLPESVIDMAMGYISMGNFLESPIVEVPPVEVLSAVAILMVFKVNFGLDDRHTDYLDEWATKIDQQLDEKRLHLFSFLQWQCFINKTLWWSTKVTEDHQSFEGLISVMDGKRFHQNFCSDGIFRNSIRVDCLERANNDPLVQALKEETGLTLPTSKPKPLYPFYWKPITGIVESYLQYGYTNDKGEDKEQVLKIAEHLSQTTFEHCLFDWIRQKEKIEEAFASMNKKVKVVYKSLVFDNVIEKSSDSINIVLPDPSSSYSTTNVPSIHWDRLTLSRFPTNFMWLSRLLARVCETDEIDIITQFSFLEKTCLKKQDPVKLKYVRERWKPKN